MKAAIEAVGLTKEYGRGRKRLRAVGGMGLCVAPGTVYGLLGRNGVGKTTTLRLLAGVLAPTAGRAMVLGEEMRCADTRSRSRFAYIPQEQQLDRSLTGGQIGRYLSRYYPKWDGGRAESMAQRFGVSLDQRVGELSGGQQRMMSVVLALASQPEVLLLDEPAAGLDPVARRELIDVLVELLSEGERPTILLSTHIVGDVERLADRVGMMHDGALELEASLDEIQGCFRRVQVVFDCGQVPDGFAPEGALRGSALGAAWTGVVRGDGERLERLFAMEGATVQLFPLGLEDLFVELFSREERS
jgi:ABC-2 type transport system ATP-binding protein